MQYQGKEGTLVVYVRFVFSDQIRQQSDRNHNCVLERKFVERPAKQDFKTAYKSADFFQCIHRNQNISWHHFYVISLHFTLAWFWTRRDFPLCLTVNFWKDRSIILPNLSAVLSHQDEQILYTFFLEIKCVSLYLFSIFLCITTLNLILLCNYFKKMFTDVAKQFVLKVNACLQHKCWLLWSKQILI